MAAIGSRRSARAFGWVLLALFSALGVLLASTAQAAVDPGADVAAEELQSFTDLLDDIAASPLLSTPIPLTSKTPSSALDLPAKIAAIKSALAGLTDFASIADALEAVSDDSGPVKLYISGPDTSSNTDQILFQPSAMDSNLRDLVFEIKVEAATASLPVSLSNSLLNLAGGSLSASLTLQSSVLQFQLDTTKATSSDPNVRATALALRTVPDASAVAPASPTTPTFTLNALANGAISSFAGSLGFGGVNVSGTGAIDVEIRATVQDPGDPDGRLRADEWSTLPLATAVNIQVVDDPSTPAVNAALTLSPNPAIPKPGGGNVGNATVTFVDDHVDGTLPVITPTFGDLEGFVNISSKDALAGLEALATSLLNLQNAGRLGLNLPFIDKRLDEVLAIQQKLATAIADLKKAPENAVDPSIKTLPTFTTIQDLQTKLAAAAGALAITPKYDPSTKRLTFGISYSDSSSLTDGINLNLGNLGIISEIVNTTAPTITLAGAADVDFTFGLDLSPLPQENNAGPLSCEDGLDNGGDPGIDAGDPACASLKTMDQRAFLDVGTSPSAAPIISLAGSARAALASASARVGLLTANVTNASLAVGPTLGEDGGAAGTCYDGTDNSGDGKTDGADSDCTVFDLRIHEEGGDGFVTLEELIQAIGSPVPSAVKVATTVNATVAGAVPVSASLGSFSVGPKTITVGGSLSGPLANAADLIENLTLDTSEIDTSELLNFSPCGNGKDDDGDGTVDDGCPGSTEPANDKAEALSTALFDKILTLLDLLKGSIDTAETESNLGLALDKPIPLLGKSVRDILGTGGIVDKIKTVLTNRGEAGISASSCTNADDDDHDGFYNDGCPTVGDAPEGGVNPDGTNQCVGTADEDGDTTKNDGCPPAIASLQSLSNQLQKLVEDAFAAAAAGAADISQTVTAAIDYVPADDSLTFTITPTFNLTRGTTFNLDLSSLISGINLASVVDGAADGNVTASLVAKPTLAFGIELDTLRPFLLGSTGLDVTATASADDLRFDAGIGPIKVSIGKDADLGSIDLGFKGLIDLAGAATEHRYFDGGPTDGIDFNATFDGTAPDGCDGVNGNTENDACAVLPLYVGGSPVGATPGHKITASMQDITAGFGAGNFELVFPNSGDLASAIAGNVLDLLLVNSGLQRLIDTFNQLLTGELFGFDFPIIGDALDKVANMAEGLGGSGGLLSIVTGAIGGTNPLEGKVWAKDVEDFVDGTLNSPSGGIGKLLLDAGLLLDPGANPITDPTGAPADSVDAFEITVQCGPEGNKQCDTGGEDDLTTNKSLEDSGSTTDATANCTNDTSQDDDNGDGVIDSSDRVNDGCPIVADKESGADCGNRVDDDDDDVVDDGCPNPQPAVPGDGDDDEDPPTTPSEADEGQCLDGEDNDDDGVIDDSCPAFDPGPAVGGPNDGEEGTECNNNDDDDGDDVRNDGCDAVLAPAGAVGQIRFDANIGQAAQADTGSVTAGFGIPGLNLNVENGGIFASAGWQVQMGFGISKKLGFFIATDNDPEIRLGANVSLSDPTAGSPAAELTATLGFLKVEIMDGDPAASCNGVGTDHCLGAGDVVDPRSSFNPQFTVDLLDPGTPADQRLTFADLSQGFGFGDLFEFDFSGEARVNASIQVKVDSDDAAFPRVMGDLHLLWRFGLADKKDPTALGCEAGCDDSAAGGLNNLSVSLDSMSLDAGTFLNKFLGPIVGDIKKYTEPLKPVIDTLTYPLPVLSDFAGKPVTLLTLCELFPSQIFDTTFIVNVAKFLAFIQSLPTIESGNPTIPLGDGNFALQAATLQQGALPDSQALQAFASNELSDLKNTVGSLIDELDNKMADGGSDVKNLAALTGEDSSDGIGITFPFLQDPSKLMGLLFKQDVVLIHWEVPDLSIGFSYSQKFGPIWYVPPVFLQINGSASVTGHLGIGYDTEGLRKVLFDGASADALLEGLFLDDKKFQTNTDVPEIEIKGRLAAGAEVSVLIFSAGAEGGINLNLALDLKDPNNDGRLKFGEVANIVKSTGNPFCIFIFTGKLSADISVYAEVDLFFWSERWSKTLADITIFEFKVECKDQPAPKLAKEISPGVLQLNIGPMTGYRDTPEKPDRAEGAAGKSQASTEINEKLTVRILDASSIEVTGLGFTQVFKTAHPGGWDKVVGDGGKGTDSITMLNGGDPAELGADCGNAVDDSDPANGKINEGCPQAGNTAESGAQCDNSTNDDASDDSKVNDGCPVRVVGWPSDFTADLKGGDDADTITGTERGDTLAGGGGNDVITAGEGNNVVIGNAGDDRLQGGTGDDDMYGDNGPTDPDDAGQSGADQINADLGEDLVYGGPGDDNLVGGISTINTQAPPKIGASIPGQTDKADEVHGGAGKDTIDGGDGDDDLFGDGDADNIQGTGGNDDIRGGDEGGSGCGTAGDTLVGGPGDDDIEAGNGDDLVIGGSVIALTDDTGDTDLDGGNGCDVMVGDNATFTNPPVRTQPTLVDPTIGGADTINGGDGGDLIWGQKDGDTINGNGGGDTIRGGDANDDIDAGDGTDFAYGEAGDDTVIGGDGIDTLEGSDGLDVILGDRGSVTRAGGGTRDNDTITESGGTGGDKIKGGEQRDIIRGQGDGDTINGDGGDDLALGGPGGDTIRGGLDNDELFGNDGVDTIFGESGHDRIVGGSDDDSTADAGDFLYGGSGNDAMLGDNGKLTSVTAGGETLKAESSIGGADLMHGEDGLDRMFGEKVGDTMFGGPQDDYMEGNGGDDAMKGEGGQDDMIGGGDAAAVPDDGETSVSGGLNIDYIAGDNASITRPGGINVADGSENRTVVLRDLDSTDAAMAGADKLFGDESRDIVFGGGEDDIIEGDNTSAVLTGGDDHVEGNGGGDTIKGQAAQDDLIGGTTQDSGGHPDGVDTIYGGDGTAAGIAANDFDYIAGDNAAILRPTQPSGLWFLDDLSADRLTLDIVRRRVQLFDVATTSSTPAAGTSAGDFLFGGAQFDTIYGQGGNDELTGQGGDDYLEGNAGGDRAWGNAGQDDLVGGTGRTDTGLASTAANGRLDGADFLFGGDGNVAETVTSDDYDTIVGDNATALRSAALGDPWTQISPNGVDDVVVRTLTFYDVGTKAAAAGAGTAGGDTLRGEANDDTMYGQGANDDMKGGTGDDYMEGNAGQDTMFGEADDDDMLGGTGLINGETLADVEGSARGRLDGGEITMQGGDGFDFMSGDNAVIRRVLVNGEWQPNIFNGGTKHERIHLIDINDTSGLVAGGDLVLGNADDDVLYGQAGNDTVKGATGQDYIEGNAGNDQLFGNQGQDDMAGGTGRVNNDPATGTNGRLDGDDVMRGEDDETDGVNVPQGGGDVMVGDNAIIRRPLTAGELWIHLVPDNKVQREVVLVDVENSGAPAVSPLVHGDDTMYGNGDNDDMWGQGGMDLMYGGAGDDDMEGNHDIDRMYGGPDQDDMTGGSQVAGRLDKGDYIYGGPAADFQIGDNGVIQRDRPWTYFVEYNPTTVKRVATRFDVGGPADTAGGDVINGDDGDDYQWGQDGNDTMHGNNDNDDMQGELGDDVMFGDYGEDAMIGDRGNIRNTKLADNSKRVTYNTQGPAFFSFVGLVQGQLDRRVSLTDDGDGAPFPHMGVDSGGADQMRGGPGHDSMHGAFGDDLMNGDSQGDWLFGADGADVLWGGKGADPLTDPNDPADPNARDRDAPGFTDPFQDRYVDYLFGGHGGLQSDEVLAADIHDYLPRVAEPSNGFEGDPQIWFVMTSLNDNDPTNDQYHQGKDWIYGGFNRDVMEGNLGKNGPDDGDRLIDWNGAYNLYTRCNASYGDDGDIRQHSPRMQEFLHTLAYASGAGYTLDEVKTAGTSAFRELALVYPGDNSNSGRAFPTTPGHFQEIACSPGGPRVR